MEFALKEKMAIVKGLNEIIMADGKARESELQYMFQLMQELDFDISFIQQSKQMSFEECRTALSPMNPEKKVVVVKMMTNMAGADGTYDESEKRVISGVINAMGLI